MGVIYIFSKEPITCGFENQLSNIAIDVDVSERVCCYKLSPLVNEEDFLVAVLDFIYPAILRSIVEVRLRVDNNMRGNEERKISDFFFEKLSAYLYITGNKNKIDNIVKALLNENNIINIEGVVNFRLREISADISAFFDMLFYEYKVQKQYEEFVSLVRDYIEIESPKEVGIHIVFKKRGFLLYNAMKADITYKALKTYQADLNFSEGNPNDFLISSLLYFLPKNIIIHVEDKSLANAENTSIKRIIDTIRTIFKERVIVCGFNSCEFCGFGTAHEDLCNYVCEDINL